MPRTRREFLRDIGVSAAALPFVTNLPSLAFDNQAKRKQRVVFIFSPNGIVPKDFWPDEQGEKFTLKRILEPLEPFKDKLGWRWCGCAGVQPEGEEFLRC